eukprot:10169941-Lingulodinium_polyedra.AAC.1
MHACAGARGVRRSHSPVFLCLGAPGWRPEPAPEAQLPGRRVPLPRGGACLPRGFGGPGPSGLWPPQAGRWSSAVGGGP